MTNIFILRTTIMIFISIPICCQAAGDHINSDQYIGLGVSRISINSDHPSIDDQSISGISLMFGLRRHNHVFELSMGGGKGVDVGPTYDIYYPEDSADYGYFSLTYQYQFRNLFLSEGMIPYFGGGYSFNSINWQSYVYDHSGDGYAIVGGVIFRIEKTWSLNLSVRRFKFSGERILFVSSDYDNHDTTVYDLTANLVYHFNIRRY